MQQFAIRPFQLALRGPGLKLVLKPVKQALDACAFCLDRTNEALVFFSTSRSRLFTNWICSVMPSDLGVTLAASVDDLLNERANSLGGR